MSRYFRNRAIQFALESSYGTEPGAWGATDVLLVRDMSFRIDRDVLPRDLILPWMGGSEHLIGTRRCEIEFEVELAGSGTPGTVPPWGKLLRACGMAETVYALSNVAYTPVSAAMESATVRVWIDGVLFTSRGCRGTSYSKLNAYGIPVQRVKMQGFDTTAATASRPAANISAWQTPLVLTDANSGDIWINPTFTAETAAFSGGTKYPSLGLEIDLGQKIEHLKLLSGESIDLSGRDAMGKLVIFLTADQEVTWRNDINNNLTRSVAFTIGSAAGKMVKIFAPKVQFVNPEFFDHQGRIMTRSEMRILPLAGNDEVRIVAA